MVSAKDLRVMPITASAAGEVVKRVHYSGKIVNNSVLHFGVFLGGKLEGAMSFGSPLDKRKVLPIVADSSWHSMLELNRMAFSEALPRNSESRCLAVAFRMIKKAYPHIEWILSFADGSQCGDGAIYRASGFLLTGIRKNNSLWRGPDDSAICDASTKSSVKAPVFSRVSLTDGSSKNQQASALKIVDRVSVTKGLKTAEASGGASMRIYKEAGFAPIPGFQLRYIRFLNDNARERLTVPVIPFSRIGEIGAGMYRGVKIKREKQAMTGVQPVQRWGSTNLPAPNSGKDDEI